MFVLRNHYSSGKTRKHKHRAWHCAGLQGRVGASFSGVFLIDWSRSALGLSTDQDLLLVWRLLCCYTVLCNIVKSICLIDVMLRYVRLYYGVNLFCRCWIMLHYVKSCNWLFDAMLCCIKLQIAFFLSMLYQDLCYILVPYDTLWHVMLCCVL